MNRFKTKLTVLVCGTLAVSVIASACTKSEMSQSQNAATSPGASAAPAKRGKLSVTIYDRATISAAEGTIENNRWTKWINEKGPANVTFTAVPRNDSKQKLNALFASGSASDLIFEYAPDIKDPLYDQKQLMPLDDMINKYSTEYKKLLEQTPALKKSAMKSDGKMYEFGKLNEAVPTNILVIRQDWLKKLNLQVPKTTDELYQVAKAFAEQDPDDNGKKDTYGLNLSNPLLYEMFGADVLYSQNLNTLYSYMLENGLPVKSWSGDKAFADFAKRLFDEGIVNKDFATDTTGAKAKQNFLNGKIGIYAAQGNSYQTWNQLWIKDYATLRQNAPGAELTVMEMPKSPEGQFMSRINNPVQMTAVVNNAAKDPQAIMKYVDFLSKPDTGTTLTFGLEGVHYNTGPNGCPAPIDPNKNKTETGYLNTDFDMLYSLAAAGKCGYIASALTNDKPDQQYAKEMLKTSMNQIYDLIQNNAQYPSLTQHEHLPTVPKELLLDASNADKEIKGIWTKAIISGASYTTNDALKDTLAVWDKYSGKKIEQFYQNWYKNKDNFMPKDVFDIVQQQRNTQNELLK